MKAQYFLFDSVLGYQVINSHTILLPDAIGTVGGLLFDGRIPPRVQMDDVIGSRQIQPQSASLQTDEEDGALALLKLFRTSSSRCFMVTEPSR